MTLTAGRYCSLKSNTIMKNYLLATQKRTSSDALREYTVREMK